MLHICSVVGQSEIWCHEGWGLVTWDAFGPTAGKLCATAGRYVNYLGVGAWAPQQAPAEQFALLPDTPQVANQHIRRSIWFCKRDTVEVEVCGLAAKVCRGRSFTRLGYNWTGLWQRDGDVALLASYLGKKICVCMCYCGKHEIWRNSSLAREWCLPIYVSTKDSSVLVLHEQWSFQTSCGTEESRLTPERLGSPLSP